MLNEANFEREAARKSGETIHYTENSAQLSMERSLKVFEAMLLLNKNADQKEFQWYHATKKKYADTYLGGVIPETLITSTKDAINTLYEVTGQDFTNDFKDMYKEPQQEKISYPSYKELVNITEEPVKTTESPAENIKTPGVNRRHTPEEFFNLN